MKDFLDKDLAIGDLAIMTKPDYTELIVVKIIAFTKQKVRVEFTNNWHFGNPGVRIEKLVESNRLCKMADEDAVKHILSKAS